MLGTVGYMSPEQVRGATADHRADIFAFGAILYEMLAGKRAFRKATSAETMTAILHEDPPAIAADCAERSFGAPASRASLFGEESGAALSIGFGPGICVGGTFGFRHLAGRPYRPTGGYGQGHGSDRRARNRAHYNPSRRG